MVIGISKCARCKKEFNWKRSKNQTLPKYCSNNCQWELHKNETLHEARKRLYENHVIKNENGCWDWKGHKNSYGYAVISFDNHKKDIFAYRFSWIDKHGDIPKGMFVCHKCDNKVCTRPDHLFLGFPKDNSKDMVSKNRQAKGNKHGMSKITEIQAKEIKELLEKGLTGSNIARQYGITKYIVSRIKLGKTWSHVVC